MYSPKRCASTFPVPSRHDNLSNLGEKYHKLRSQMMHDRSEGITATYNRFHDPSEQERGIERLRELHAMIDEAVATAYGWTDLGLGHGFHETNQGVRFTISEVARRKVLELLLRLNHERHAQEAGQGLDDVKKAKPSKAPRKSGRKAASEPSLFGEEE